MKEEENGGIVQEEGLKEGKGGERRREERRALPLAQDKRQLARKWHSPLKRARKRRTHVTHKRITTSTQPRPDTTTTLDYTQQYLISLLIERCVHTPFV
jgi:hypothetical protein